MRWNGSRYADGDSGAITKADNVVIMKVRNHPDGNRDVRGRHRCSPTQWAPCGDDLPGREEIEGRWQRTKASASFTSRQIRRADRSQAGSDLPSLADRRTLWRRQGHPEPGHARRTNTWPGRIKSAILAAESTSSSASRVRVGLGAGKSELLELGDIQPDLVSSFAEKRRELVGWCKNPIQRASRTPPIAWSSAATRMARILSMRS